MRKNELFNLYANEYKSFSLNESLSAYNVTQSKIPNKLLNTSLAFFNRPNISSYISERVVFLPNQNFIKLDASKKLVFYVHDISFIRFPELFSRKRRMWHSFVNIKSLLKRANSIITGSTFTAEELKQVFPSETDNKIITFPLGVDSSYFITPECNPDTLSTGHNVPDCFILHIGTIEPRKNIETVIHTFNAIAKKDNNLHLVLVGKIGWKSKKVFHMIKNSPYKSRILYTGYVSEDDKKLLFSKALAFVFPSWYEGFGLPPLEAMAAGCPVVASSVSAIPEVVGDAGILVQPYQTEDFIHSVKTLLKDSQLRKEFSEKGKMRASRFSWQETAKKTLDVLTGQL
jgi:glycosyltransferase involved in cell wall biosynthesis